MSKQKSVEVPWQHAYNESGEIVGAFRADYTALFDAAMGMETVKWKAEQARRERRERIATAALQGLMADQSHNDTTYSCLARIAVKAANALITELDKPEEDKT